MELHFECRIGAIAYRSGLGFGLVNDGLYGQYLLDQESRKEKLTVRVVAKKSVSVV